MIQSKTDIKFDLHKQIAAARILRAELVRAGHDDADLISDTIEGETDLREEIARALNEIDEQTVLVDGLTSRISDMTARKGRIEASIEILRGLIEQAMTIGEIPKLLLPTATLSLKAKSRSAVIVDESAIPSQYYTSSAPKLDKSGLTKALREADISISEAHAKAEAGDISADKLADIIRENTIPGAELEPASMSLAVRRK